MLRPPLLSLQKRPGFLSLSSVRSVKNSGGVRRRGSPQVWTGSQGQGTAEAEGREAEGGGAGGRKLQLAGPRPEPCSCPAAAPQRQSPLCLRLDGSD